MYTTCSASLDAVTMRRLLHGHRRMFDSASPNPTICSFPDGPLPFRARRNLSSVATRTRRNATSTTSASQSERPTLNDSTWLGKRIVLGDAPASRRGYAMRSSGGKPPSGKGQKKASTAKDSGNAREDFTDSPHRMAPTFMGQTTNLVEQLGEYQESLKREVEEHALTKKNLDDKSNALKREETARYQDQQRMEAQMRNMQNEHETRLDRTDAEAYARIKREQAAVTAEIEQSLKNAQTHERNIFAETQKLKDARAEVEESRRRQYKESREQLVEEMAKVRKSGGDKNRDHQKKVEALLEAKFADKVRQLQAAGASRLQERETYDNYREVWAALDREANKLSANLHPFQTLADRKIVYWTEAQRKFKHELGKSWLPAQYPKIKDQLLGMFITKIEQAKQAEREWTSKRETLQHKAMEVRMSGHNTRKLTRHHRFDDERTAQNSIALAYEFFNELPIDLMRYGIDRDSQVIERRIASAPPGADREQLETTLGANKKERSSLTALRAAFAKYREAIQWQAVSHSSLREQEIYMLCLPIDTEIRKTDRAWAINQKDQHEDEDTRKDRSAFREDQHDPKTDLRKFKRAIRMRQLLQENLGESMNEDERKALTEEVNRRKKKAESEASSEFHRILGSRSSRPLASSIRTTQPARSERPAHKATIMQRITSERTKSRQAKPSDVKGDVSTASTTTLSRKARKGKNARRPSKRARERAKALRASVHEPVTSAATTSGSSSPSNLNLKPTASKQAPHTFWPTFPRYSGIGFPTASGGQTIDTRDSAMDESIMDSGSHNSDRGSESVLASDYGQSSASPLSASLYQPSGNGETESLGSRSSANDPIEGSEPADLPQLKYRMSQADHRAAIMASPNTSAAYWTYKLYKNSEGKSPPNYYCTTLEQAEARAKEFLNEPVIGFDIEWEVGHSPGKSGIKKNVSLIQIATDDKIALFHLAVFKGDTIEALMPASLRTILESRNIVKAGVNIQGDASRMSDCLNVQMTGIFELSHLYRVVMFADTPNQINRRPFKLASQVQEVLLLPLKKDSVRTSAWSKKLDLQQTDYAASDAYAGFRLFHALEAKRRSMDPTPPRPAFWEEHKPIQLGDGTLIQAKTRKKATSGTGKKAVEAEDDDEDEEFFDAVENLDTYDLGADTSRSAGVPLGGLSVSYPTLPSIENEIETSLSNMTISGAAVDKTQPERLSKKPGPPPSAEVDTAEQWVAQWRESRPNEYVVKASHYQLRAYSLWHHQGLPCKDVAALLRENPLSLTTVASYVLEAVKRESLEYDADNVRDVLNLVPPATQTMRYGKILEEIRG